MKDFVKISLTVISVVAVLYFVWIWGFCRFYVPPGYMAVVVAKYGKPLPPGKILASKGERGIQEEVLGEGRHFLNPYLYDYEIKETIFIPPGKIGIVTAKVGEDLPSGEFLADQTHKGIRKQILGPGRYRLNPYGYKVDIVDATGIPIGYVGVITSLAGVQGKENEFSDGTQKGIIKDILQPGFYYINPKQYKVDILEVGVNQVSVLGHTSEVKTKGKIETSNIAIQELERKALETQQLKREEYLKSQVGGLTIYKAGVRGFKRESPRTTKREEFDLKQKKPSPEAVETYSIAVPEYIEFPSRDGFIIRLDMTIEFEFLPHDIAWLFKTYGDLPAVVDKVILPQITSVARNKGSEYGAKDFIIGEGREKFQSELTLLLKERLQERRIVVHNAIIRHVEVPDEILVPIQQASIAKERDLTNKEKQNTAKKLAQLNTEVALIDQKREQVQRETEKIKAEYNALQEKEVAQIKAETEKIIAEIDKKRAEIIAEIKRLTGNASAKAIQMVEGEYARGLEMKVKAFGDSHAYSLFTFANNLNTNIVINIIHTGPGTLWTDLDKATMGNAGAAIIIKESQKSEIRR